MASGGGEVSRERAADCLAFSAAALITALGLLCQCRCRQTRGLEEAEEELDRPAMLTDLGKADLPR